MRSKLVSRGVDFGNNTCYCGLENANLRCIMARLPIDIRAMLLKSGKEQFLAHGFEKASLRTICKEAGLTTGAFYNHFSGKEDLFAALAHRNYLIWAQGQIMNWHPSLTRSRTRTSSGFCLNAPAELNMRDLGNTWSTKCFTLAIRKYLTAMREGVWIPH